MFLYNKNVCNLLNEKMITRPWFIVIMCHVDKLNSA